MDKYDWKIYIPDEGHWPIDYYGPDVREARKAYLVWAVRKRLPKGSTIMCFNHTTDMWYKGRVLPAPRPVWA